MLASWRVSNTDHDLNTQSQELCIFLSAIPLNGLCWSCSPQIFRSNFGNLDDRQFSWTFTLPDTNSSHLKMDDLESFFVSFWGVWAHFQGGYVFQTSLATEVTFTVSPDPPKSPETNVPGRRNAGETQGIRNGVPLRSGWGRFSSVGSHLSRPLGPRSIRFRREENLCRPECGSKLSTVFCFIPSK